MDKPKRKHQATGQPRGGKRENAGRPPGVNNALEIGEAQAVKSLRWKVPEDAPTEIADHASEAWMQIVNVMRGQHVNDAQNVLRSSFRIRDEVCGSPVQKTALTDTNGEQVIVEIHKYPKEDE